MKIKLPKDIKMILEILKTHGQGYVVGGYVRDKLMGLTPHDADFVTDIEYSKLMEMFSEFKPKSVGKHFGVIIIKVKNRYYEIAKMREDIGTPKDRKLQEVHFIKDIYTDLKRRDFTINAIAYDGEKLYYHPISMVDIKNRNLRFIGKTEVRIKEDPLRILRGFRFLATKNLYSCINLYEISKNLDLLDSISAHRIREEFQKIILSSNLKVLKIMQEVGIIEKIFPGMVITDSIITSLASEPKDAKKRLLHLFVKTQYDVKKLEKYEFAKSFKRMVKKGVIDEQTNFKIH